MSLTLKSPAFKQNNTIPTAYTCDGVNVSPPLEWSEVPRETQSLVLIMDDPDVPAFVRPDQMYDHWVLFNIPPTISSLAENTREIPGAVQGTNTSGKLGYTGPCPPDRQHRYFFKLYALDALLDLPPGVSKKQVEEAMKGHILAQTDLIGVYNRPQNMGKS